MGSGLCKRTDETPMTAARGFDGLYRKIVFNYAKQWTRCSDKHKKSEKKNSKHNKGRRKKPIISGPFPADPDRLHGDKWQYVILTRLDTEPPPERPPRTKRSRRQETSAAAAAAAPCSGVSGIVRWGSERRRSFGRRRQPTATPPPLSADELSEPIASSGRVDVGDGGEIAAAAAEKKAAPSSQDAAVEKSSLWVVLWWDAVVAARRNGLLKSVARANAMASDLSS